MDDILKFDIAAVVADALTDCFDSMLSMAIEPGDGAPPPTLQGGRIAGRVGLAGMVQGCIMIEIDDAMARSMTAAMLQRPDPDIDPMEDVKQAIGDICTIIGGNLASKCWDAGMTCRLSPPSITAGADFEIASLKTERCEDVVFHHGDHPVIVRVGLGIDASAEPEASQLSPGRVDQLKAFEIHPVVSKAMVELFDTMLSMPIEALETGADVPLDGERIVASVPLAGPLTGDVHIYLSKVFATRMTAAMLATPLSEVKGDEEVRRVMGEICSTVGRKVTSNLCDAGLACAVSCPCLTGGSDFIIQSQPMMRCERYAFKHREEFIVVEAGFTIDDQALPIESNAADTAEDRAAAEAPAQAIGECIRTSLSECTLEMILDIPVEITVEFGRTQKRIVDLLDLGQGSVVEFFDLAGEPVAVRVNQRLIAKGEVVVENEKYGVRINETISRMARIQSLQ